MSITQGRGKAQACDKASQREDAQACAGKDKDRSIDRELDQGRKSGKERLAPDQEDQKDRQEAGEDEKQCTAIGPGIVPFAGKSAHDASREPGILDVLKLRVLQEPAKFWIVSVHGEKGLGFLRHRR
jgi:hypothetical protein